MITRKKLLMLVLGSVVLFSWQQAGSARHHQAKGRRIDAFSTTPYEEYQKWSRQFLGRNAGTVPHYVLATVARRKSPTIAYMQIAAIGELIGGYKIEVQPIILERIPGAPSLRQPLGVPTLYTFGLDNDEQGNVTLIQPYLIVPLEPVANAIEMRWSFRDQNEVEDRVLTMIVPLENRDRDQALTFGFVDGDKLQAAKIKGIDKGMTAESFDMGPGECYPGCNFVSIFGGPNDCNVWKCCLDKWPITDPTTCEILCWSECWTPPN
ncbi:MAG: hypothetical protein IPM66_16160 [Acidobacteriota bacterium]|nr:MAG: hypothetical protein IPM66_16160 [Acidobacteriota bacterium]